MVSTTTARQLMTNVINDNSSADITAAEVRSVFSAAFDAIDRVESSVDVRDFGALLDGATDDTAAWNAALATGKSVRFPAGVSVITNRINFPFIEGVAIIGAGRNKSFFKVDTFNMAATAVFHIQVAHQGMHDLSINFTQPSTSIRANLRAYPPTIDLNGNSRCELSRLRIENGYYGIKAVGNCGGAVIDDIQIGCFNRGALFDGALDSIRINRWHFWPFGVGADANLLSIWNDGTTICLDFGKVDDLNMSSVLTLGGRILFNDYGSGAVFGVASTITLDADYGRMEFNAGELSIASVYDSAASSNDYAIRQTGGELRIAGLALEGGPLGTFAAVNVEGGTFVASDIQFTTFSNTMIAFRQTGGQMLLSNGYFREQSGAARSNALIQVNGGRAVLTGLMASDRVGGAANFISVATDDWHVVANNTAPAWTFNFPASATKGIYAPNHGSSAPYVNSALTTQARIRKLTGTLDGSGNITVAHGITSALTTIIDVSGTYTTAGNVNTKVANITFDATNITMTATASGASRPYTLHITFA